MQANTRKVWGSNKPALSDIDWESGPDRKLTHNTWRETIDGEPAVRFHATVIVRRIREDIYELNSGGYRTATTKQRLNALLSPAMQVWQKDFEWFVSTQGSDIPFTDGMRVARYGYWLLTYPPQSKGSSKT